jgi:very-short-patch-repair endonuclease
MENFIRQVLEIIEFKDLYIEKMIAEKTFFTEDDQNFYSRNKSLRDWSVRIRGRLGFKSFTKQSLNYWIYRGYTELEARDINLKHRFKSKQPTPMQKEFWMLRGYNEDESVYKINSFRKTKTEYWESRGFTKEESLAKIVEYQIENSEKLKKKRKEKPELFEDINWTQKKYWIRNGLSEEEAIKKVSEMQTTFSLEICIKKYGEEEGTRVWLDRQQKWVKKVFNENTHIAKGTSKIANDFLYELRELIDFSGTFLFDSEEKYIYCIDSQRSFKYDFTYSEKRKIIEINGEFWHASPLRFKDVNEINAVSGKTVKEIRDFDLKKIELAEKYGYEVIIVWENEIRKNRQETIEKCLNFLKY